MALRDVAEPTDEELADLSLVGQALWELDDNRLEPGRDYDINVGSGKKPFDTGFDAADGKLFAGVSKVVWDRPTFWALYQLRDNYQASTGEVESESQQERAEISAFLDTLMATRPMQYAYKYLVAKDLMPADRLAFKRALYNMWFSFYRRDGQNDSSGFEHVFLGESDTGQVSGFHNWLQFWIEEGKGHVDYKGYIQPRNRSEVVDDADRVLAVQFAWQGEVKNVTTMFIGTSPEFEFALYTIYFLAGQERNLITIAGYDLCIRCYAIRSRNGDKIGSAFAELLADGND